MQEKLNKQQPKKVERRLVKENEKECLMLLPVQIHQLQEDNLLREIEDNKLLDIYSV